MLLGRPNLWSKSITTQHTYAKSSTCVGGAAKSNRRAAPSGMDAKPPPLYGSGTACAKSFVAARF